MKSFRYVFMVILAVFLALPALSGVCGKGFSVVKSFHIDGKRFLPDHSAGDYISWIREELKRQGLQVPDLGTCSPGNRIFADGLREAGEIAARDKPALPKGFRAEHTLGMDSDSGRVDLALGSIENSSRRMGRTLSDSGWECIEPIPGQPAVAINRNGKETIIVLLEEKEGRFLQVRTVE